MIDYQEELSQGKLFPPIDQARTATCQIALNIERKYTNRSHHTLEDIMKLIYNP